MKLNITKKLATGMLGLASLGLATTANAQTVLWGAGSSNTMIDSMGRFASTDGTIAGAGWTTSVGSPDSAAVWTWSQDGVSQGNITAGWVNGGTGEYITSPSIADGCAFYDSDFYFSTIVPTQTPMSSTLISPAVDLTGYTDSVIAVKFHVSYLEFDIPDLTVGVSVDGGTSWTDIDYRPFAGGAGVRAWYNDWVVAPMPGLLDGVTNLSDCRIRFIHNGFLYYTAIDDVSIIISPEYDLTFPLSIEDYDNRTIGAPIPYSRMDVDQIDGQSMIYGAMVYNQGGKTLPASANARVEYNIEMDMGGTWTSVYTNSWALGVDVGALDTASISGDLSTVLNTVLNVEGYYRVTYNVAHDLMDYDLSNDTSSLEFWVTNNVISTSPPSMTVDGPDANDFAFPGAGAGNVVQEFEWGNLYYFPAGATAGEFLDSVVYRMYASTTFNPAVSEVETTVNVYEWVDGNGDGAVSFEDELQIITLARDTFTVTAADYGTHMTSAVKIADPNSLNPNTNSFDCDLPLGDDKLYAVMIGQSNSDGIIDAAGTRNGFFASTYVTDFDWNQSLNLVESFTPMRVVEGPAGSPGTESWFSGFTGAAQHPAIELRLDKNLQCLVGVEDVEAENAAINVYPNPASAVVTIQADFDAVQENITYIVTDATGRVVYMENRPGIQNDVLTLDVNEYAAGVYFVTVKTNNGTSTQRFVKQ